MRALGWFIALIALALVAIAAGTYPTWLLLHPQFDFPFHRIADRIGMLALAGGLVAVARRLHLNDRASLGFALPVRAFVRELAMGLALGVATLAPAVFCMVALGLLRWSASEPLTAGHGLLLLMQSLGSGLAVALIEETFLRGAMFTGIARESGTPAALLATSVIYSASHFVASVHIPPEAVRADSGLVMLSGALHAFAHPVAMADAFLCLAVAGVVLGSVRACTGNIAACIGIHAGWVWLMLTVHGVAQPVRDAPLGFLLSSHDGFVGWLVLLWSGLGGAVLYAFYSRREQRAGGGAIAGS